MDIDLAKLKKMKMSELNDLAHSMKVNEQKFVRDEDQYATAPVDRVGYGPYYSVIQKGLNVVCLQHESRHVPDNCLMPVDPPIVVADDHNLAAKRPKNLRPQPGWPAWDASRCGR